MMKAKGQILACLVIASTALHTNESHLPYSIPQVSCYFMYPFLHLNVSIHHDDIALLGDASQFRIQTRSFNESWFTWSRCTMAANPWTAGATHDLDCKMWNLVAESKLALSQEYSLRLEFFSNKSWSFISKTDPPLWNPTGNLFLCFTKYEVKDLRVIGQTKNELTISYQQNPDNSFYKFVIKSQHVEVSPATGYSKGQNMSASYEVNPNCHGLCMMTIKGLQSCWKYKLCVITEYFNRTEPFYTCIDTSSMMCGSGFSHEKIAFLVFTISLALIIIALALALKKWRSLKQRRKHSQGDLLDNEDLVSERESSEEVFLTSQTYDPVTALTGAPDTSEMAKIDWSVSKSDLAESD